MEEHFKKGSVKSFDINWKKRPETLYNHWSKGAPRNQIQLAFSQHYDLFKRIINKEGKLKVLEVGCGRGSLSSYFAEDGHDCFLLDMSETVIGTAKEIFKTNGHQGSFHVGDANSMTFEDDKFDVIVSIGLLEHFENLENVINEQFRVLRKDGVLINYIVPENLENVQKDYNWINDILKSQSKKNNQKIAKKEDLYRSDSDSKRYIEQYKASGFQEIYSSGVYPLPMISPSIDFPFTLMDEESEKILIKQFNEILEKRKENWEHPWMCEESYGQAFLVSGKKL